MAVYAYKARDNNGELVKGTMDAMSKDELVDKLRKMGYMTTQAILLSSGFAIDSFFEKMARVGSDEMLMFYIQLSNMINAGITIVSSLKTLSKQIQSESLSSAIDDIARRIESGSSLSDAFGSRPRMFPKLFVNMIKAGEASGKLDVVLMRYAKFFENQEDLKQKVKGVLFYPLILLCAGLIVTLFIVTFIIPQFAELYLKAGITLPGPTRVVYGIGILIKHYWYLLVVLALAIISGVKYYFGTDRGGVFLDSLRLRLFIIGPLYRKIAIARFTRTLATLLESGVPILQALDISGDVVGNKILARVLENVRKSVEKGEAVSDSLKTSKEFPLDVVQMIAVGEESGGLSDMLNKIADFYDINITYAVKKMTTMIEPILLIIMGVMVGGITASMLMPIFDMVKTLRH